MKVIYSKFNRERLPQYQTSTIVYIDKVGGIFAQKKALTKEAYSHISSIHDNYIKLRLIMNDIKIAESHLEENFITFEYINSPSLDSLLFEEIIDGNKNKIFSYLNQYKLMVLQQPLVYNESFESGTTFKEVFGLEPPFSNVMCQRISNLDLTFENVTLDKGQFTVIDYEWVFEMLVPVDFILYRSINEFYAKYADYLSHLAKKEEFLLFFGINLDYIQIFEQMEEGFQRYVFGEGREYQNAQRVLKDTSTLEDVLSVQFEINKKDEELQLLNVKLNQIQKDVYQQVSSLHSEISSKDNTINELTKQRGESEVQLVAKEKEIMDFKQEIKNKDGHINQLLESERKLENVYSSRGWRILSKYYSVRDRVVPQNSKRKVLLKLASKTLKNPRLMLSKLNKTNFKKIKYYLNSEKPSQLMSRIDSYVDRHDDNNQQTELQLYTVTNYDELEFNHFEKPLVSIIIPVYNQWKYTYSCLASILENTPDLTYEVIIADDMSTDETIDIEKIVKNITIVRDGVNRGFLLNCNNAAKSARGKYVFFLNNDTNVQANWLSSLVELIEPEPSIGMVGSKLVYPDGRLQEAGGIIWNDASGWNYGRLDDPEKPEYNYVKEADYISGAAILIRHTIWQELGGFDERYVPAYFEDTDLAFEVRRLGYKVLLQPKSVIVHFEGISHGTDTSNGIKSYQVTNKEKFMDKWKEELLRDQFPNAEHIFWAKDRSRNRKTIVVVDHYVPHYDKDAGSRATYFYLQLFVSMGFHVIFIGDNFFKHEPYTSNLQELGIEVLYGDYYAKNINKWIKNNGAYIDYVYLNRPHISIKYMETFKKFTSAKIIYFGHDLHFLREMRNYELTGNTNLMKSSEEWKKTEFSLFNDADVIHVVGSYEQSLLQNEFPNKPVRNIPLFPYEHSYNYAKKIEGFDARKDLLFVGGFNHAPNYDGIVWFLDEIFDSIKRYIPNVKLYIVGSNPPDDLKARSAEDVIVTGFVSDEELERYYNQSKLVIVPLRYGAGVKGKVVEAIYYQVPVITTSIGSEGLEESEIVMTIANDAQQFAHSVIQLYQDETMWNAHFQASVQYIEKYFTREAASKILALDFKD
ncbi:glycosyltransferase [Paenibacillus sp. FSL R5-0490]|uniref:glycosyltransferase n=1 Tax=Paenibacillus sp. FSL R5-0490 TaxID=1920424 RepID=UPI0030CE2477